MRRTFEKDQEILADRLEADPGRFEPTTAFRVAQAASGPLAICSHIGVSLIPLPLAGFRRGDGGRSTLKSALPSPLGPLGVLPPSYLELAMREERNRAHGLTAFFDLFGARIAELFIDACEKYRLARLLRWDRREGGNGFRTALFSLTGFGTARLLETSNVDAALILRFSGFLASRTRNASALGAMLREFTGLPVKIELFRGRWLSIPPEERSTLGRRSSARLGDNAVAGAAIHNFSGGFRVVLGPLEYRDYLALAPGSRAVEELFALIRLFAGSSLAFDLQLVLKKEHIPFCRLDGPEGAPRLGWNTWARIAPAPDDCGDAVVTQDAAVPLPQS
ncbi:type VI secretion system baseplate subunit TssG [Chelativorans sp. AA-79]|uniref:type VI secretion system baseplate subunit TssG n=1 Tax=Chelativorans sp. AA-79 TaxID=3028735 RepID=UPI0023F9F2E8|nr:type VI secretion system baseplate subunit TssG [Chelativorans sp. AA-79]WEX08243.1 type VI secretion system baseplate subunit TssG [Chelativorans sp. AA-79]